MAIICVVSTIMKIWLTPWGVPLSDDALLYHDYARMLSLGEPYQHAIKLHNVGFSYFLSVFFYIFHDFSHDMQRMTTIIISSIGLLPVYFLAKRFIPIHLALGAVTMLSLDPRVMENSGLAITEPLYLAIFTTSLYYIISGKPKLAFLLSGVTYMIRFEAIFLFIALCVIYWVRGPKTKQKAKQFIFLVTIMVLPLFIISSTNLATLGYDGFISQITHEIKFLTSPSGYIIPTPHFWGAQLGNSLLHLGWSLFPTFFIFIIPAIYFCITRKTIVLLGVVGILALPGVYAYLDAYDMRYFFSIYPMLAIICMMPIPIIQSWVYRNIIIPYKINHEPNRTIENNNKDKTVHSM